MTALRFGSPVTFATWTVEDGDTLWLDNIKLNSKPRGVKGPPEGHNGLVCDPAQEGVNWIPGHHGQETEAGRALLVAFSLSRSA